MDDYAKPTARFAIFHFTNNQFSALLAHHVDLFRQSQLVGGANRLRRSLTSHPLGHSNAFARHLTSTYWILLDHLRYDNRIFSAAVHPVDVAFQADGHRDRQPRRGFRSHSRGMLGVDEPTSYGFATRCSHADRRTHLLSAETPKMMTLRPNRVPVTDSESQPRVPHHRTYGSVSGGSVQTRDKPA
jgi:hypothetical protein